MQPSGQGLSASSPLKSRKSQPTQNSTFTFNKDRADFRIAGDCRAYLVERIHERALHACGRASVIVAMPSATA
ncbi:hypothetical protein G4G27_17265 [Sphingomonas sp. So64.6b]|uniref:hypothetical protein n=1 Tax=Sphingomonas sp. So64.6b TaxID=2997354 RepID=UPI0016047292|nr:hypothetical protein [Sphingomonas sp. So64.6b]QNA85536.1 hypothetical protein G4G27_17265 [Sphingomonas sp. So64.6b]